MIFKMQWGEMRERVTALVALLMLVPMTAWSADKESSYSRQYVRCMDKAAGTTALVQDCQGEEGDKQEKRLNAIYQELMRRFRPKNKAALRKSERAWEEFRKAQCEYVLKKEGGGTVGPMESSAWWLEMTIKRANDLELDLKFLLKYPDDDYPDEK